MPAMDGWTTEVKAGVEGRLVAFFETERARVTAIAPEADALHGAIEALTMRGGKRLRPAVLYAAFRGVRPDGGLGDVVDACAGLELLQLGENRRLHGLRCLRPTSDKGS